MQINLLEKFCDKNSIAVCTFQKAAELINDPEFEMAWRPTKGTLVHSPKENRNAILYDDTMQDEEKYFTFAHEIGHYVMKHLTDRRDTKNAAETEADVFASVLMALSVFTELKEVALT